MKTPGFLGFTPDEEKIVKTALSDAEKMVWKSLVQLSHVHYKKNMDQFIQADRFFRWFGDWDSDNMEAHSKRYDTVVENIRKTLDGLRTQTIQFTKDTKDQKKFLSVDPSGQPGYQFFTLGNKFFNYPDYDKHIFSMPGLLVWGMTHLMANTEIIQKNWEEASNLAKNTPEKAVHNTSSYMYFVNNSQPDNSTPTQMGSCRFFFVRLKISNGRKYMSVDGGGGVHADMVSDKVNDDASLAMISIRATNLPDVEGKLFDRDILHILPYNGSFYFSAYGGGGGILAAGKDLAFSAETFIIYKVAANMTEEPSGEIVQGNSIKIQTLKGNYFCADNGGGAGVSCNNKDKPEVWTKFILEFI